MGHKKVKIEMCIYCGQVKELKPDHIPPKNLFPKPRPDNLITVPSCSECNNSASKDDEYFRLMITIRYDVAYHQEALKIIPSVLRSLSKPTKKGFNKAFHECLRKRNAYTPAGIYLGKVGTYMPNFERIENVVKRIIKGLFYHHNGYRLSDQYNVRVLTIDSYDENDIENSISIRNIFSCFTDVKPITIGDGVFTYWHIPSEEKFVSSWLLVFYQRISFVGLTQLK